MKRWVLSALSFVFMAFVQVTLSGTEGLDGDLGKFIAVDTSRLMRQPDGHMIFGVEPAFIHLKFARPVDFTHAGDGSSLSP